jgi:hypothetical protein
MKKIIIVGMLLLAVSISRAQTKTIKANPLGLAFGIANAGFEFSTTESQSLTISGIYFDVFSISGYGLGADYRFYFDGEAISGWHAGPSLGYLSLEDDSNNSGSIISIGGEVGHQWIFGEHFALDLFVGYGFVTGGDDLEGLDAPAGSIGLSLGYAW